MCFHTQLLDRFQSIVSHSNHKGHRTIRKAFPQNGVSFAPLKLKNKGLRLKQVWVRCLSLIDTLSIPNWQRRVHNPSGSILYHHMTLVDAGNTCKVDPFSYTFALITSVHSDTNSNSHTGIFRERREAYMNCSTDLQVKMRFINVSRIAIH